MKFNLKEIISSIADVGQKLFKKTELKKNDLDTILSLCDDLISNKGAAFGITVARDITDLYQELTLENKLLFFQKINEKYKPNHTKVAEAIDKCAKHARSGKGPSLLDVKTYRYRGHSMSDAQQYRTKEEVEEYRKIDPITQVEKIILSKKYGTKSNIEKIDKKVKNIITKCEEFSESSPFPDKSIMYDVVYEQKDYPFIKHKID